MNKRVRSALTATLSVLGLLALGGAAYAATGTALETADAGPALGEMLRAVLDAFRGGDAVEAGALAIVLLVAVARRYGAKLWGPLGSGEAAAAMVLVGSIATSLAAQLAGPATVSLAILWTAIKIGAGAAGGYAILGKLVAPLLRKLRDHLPGRVRIIVDIVLWVFQNPGDAVKSAEAAGDAAVKAHPGKGAAAVVGEPTVWPPKSDERN